MTQRERDRLRSLAGRQREAAGTGAMRALRADWRLHGAFDPASRPMVRIEVGPFAHEVIDPELICEGADARRMERQLLLNLYAPVELHDDTVVDDFYAVPIHSTFVPFGIQPERIETGGLGHRYVPKILDLKEDFGKLGKSFFTIDRARTQRECEQAEGAFGDLLPPRIRGSSPRVSPWKDLVLIMRMEDLFTALYDYEELYHEMMRRLIADHMEHLDEMERAGAILPTADDQYLFQGSYCFTDELPVDQARTTRDIWGYLDAQEASSISPSLFAKVLLPYYQAVARRFGLLSYGCCEPVHALWHGMLDSFDNLRKIFISPWCDEEKMGDALRNRNVVFLKKPPSNFLGVDRVLNESAVKAHFTRTALASSGCKLEIVQRDVYSLCGAPEKAKRYIALIRSCMEKHV